jgi:hypothetical protein
MHRSEADAKQDGGGKVGPGPFRAPVSMTAADTPAAGAIKSPAAPPSAPGKRGTAGSLDPQQLQAHALAGAFWSSVTSVQQVTGSWLRDSPRRAEQQESRSATLSAPSALGGSQAQKPPIIGWTVSAAASSQEANRQMRATSTMRILLNFP